MLTAFKNTSYSLGARWIHTMTGKPLENRFINVVENRIDSITVKPTQDSVYDFDDDCRILPGTVNMHAHLELSQLPAPLDTPVGADGRRPMAPWIARLMEFRRGPDYEASAALWAALLRSEVLSESNAVVDIVPPSLAPGIGQLPTFPAMYRFAELIAWTETKAAELLKTQSFQPPNLRYGVCPHAPQTICPALLEGAVRLGVPVAMHLAETREEIEFLATGGGPLLDLMRRSDPDYSPKNVILGTRPMDYLERLAAAPKALVIHGNYLDDEELEFLAARRDTMAVVFCPRSHAYFGHDKYPLKKMLDWDVNVLLGTDSLASAPDLSLVAEMKFILEHYPEIAPETVFRMGTILGAEFLDRPDFGTLQPGKPARFAFV